MWSGACHAPIVCSWKIDMEYRVRQLPCAVDELARQVPVCVCVQVQYL